jgi:hypothetical protein
MTEKRKGKTQERSEESPRHKSGPGEPGPYKEMEDLERGVKLGEVEFAGG